MPPKPGAAKGVRIGPVQIYQIFNVSRDALKTRGLKSVNGKYDLQDFWKACRDLIRDKMNSELSSNLDDSQDDINELKRMKTLEEVRKLKIENDIKEGILVPGELVAEQYSIGIKAMCDVLDAMPSRVKMRFPDISQPILDAINVELAEARNKAAERIAE